MLYPILNRTSPVPTSTKLNILKLYVSPILTYAGSSWGPFIGPSQWNRLESVQNIGIRTITGMPTIVKNSVLLKSTNFKSIQNSIRSQTKSMFYKNSFSNHAHIRLLENGTATPFSKAKKKKRPKQSSSTLQTFNNSTLKSQEEIEA
ncbi:hypothetical protein QTP88_016921 [Uroleucon formosanum]